jgi:hypothetical protein
MIEDGELTSEKSTQPIDAAKDTINSEIHLSESLRESMRNNMTHLPTQEEQGKSGVGRRNEFFRIFLMLVLLGVVVWWLYYGGFSSLTNGTSSILNDLMRK